jgi:hypothetical protein
MKIASPEEETPEEETPYFQVRSEVMNPIRT